MQNRPFIYNPSKDIQRTYEKTAEGITQGFEALAAKRMQDYTVVKQTYDQIDELKQGLNIHNQGLVTNEANAILDEASSIIKQNKKLDYKQMGALRERIKEIGYMKRNTELSTQSVEDIMGRLVKNAPNIYDLGKSQRELLELYQNKDLLKSPGDITKKAEEIYKKSLNMSRLASERLFFGAETKNIPVNTERGLEYYKVKIPKGFIFNEETQKLEPKSEEDLKSIKASILQGEEINTFAEQVIGSSYALGMDYDSALQAFIDNQIESAVSYEKTIETTSQRQQREASAGLSNQRAALVAEQIGDFEAKIERENKKLQNGTIMAAAAMKRAENDAENLGIKKEEFYAEYKSNGWTRQPDGSMVYNPKDDIRQSNKMEAIKANKASTEVSTQDFINKLGDNADNRITIEDF